MKKVDIIPLIISNQKEPQQEKGLAFAPTNIALCKYWGKRDTELNLPNTSSLSIALPTKGAYTDVTLCDQATDIIVLNDEVLLPESRFVTRVTEFLDLFRQHNAWHLHIDINMNIPVAAGLASSACGFASLTLALNDLFAWGFSNRELSILARLGSGSAARSFWTGFVEWHAGAQSNGMDSFAEPLSYEWPELCVGILPINNQEKPISSREAMQRTVSSSMLYQSWPKKVTQDMVIIRQALHSKNFSLLGGTSESNALSMHATMLAAWPPICYYLPETIEAMHHVWALRKNGIEVYFTQDAGPNLKLLFQEENSDKIKTTFPQVEIIKTFE